MKTYETQLTAQQHLLRVVPQGYCWWTAGVIPLEKRDVLAEKFADIYGTRLGKDRRYDRKRRGLANAEAVAAMDGSVLRWVLVATDGDGPVHEKERLRDARTSSGRILWGDDYLLQESRRPTTRGGGTHWSWWLTRECESRTAKYADLAAKTNPDELASYVKMQLNRPLHSGVRTQLAKIFRRAKTVQAHHFPNRPWAGPDPDHLPFITGFRSGTSAHTGPCSDDD